MNKTVKNSLLIVLFVSLLCMQHATHCINFNDVKSFVMDQVTTYKSYITTENCFRATVFTGFACFVGFVGYYVWKSGYSKKVRPNHAKDFTPTLSEIKPGIRNSLLEFLAEFSFAVDQPTEDRDRYIKTIGEYKNVCSSQSRLFILLNQFEYAMKQHDKTNGTYIRVMQAYTDLTDFIGDTINS